MLSCVQRGLTFPDENLNSHLSVWHFHMWPWALVGEDQLNHLNALLWCSLLITQYLLGVLSALGTVQKNKLTKAKGPSSLLLTAGYLLRKAQKSPLRCALEDWETHPSGDAH